MATYSICTQTFDIGDEPKAKALNGVDGPHAAGRGQRDAALPQAQQGQGKD